MRRSFDILKMWLWGKTQQTIWHTKASKGQLDQIIWRLGVGDTQAALNLAQMLRKRVYGE